ncbi:hypothetical protein U1Q18_024446, partial [Sarracenia purpurea var. burkii]
KESAVEGRRWHWPSSSSPTFATASPRLYHRHGSLLLPGPSPSAETLSKLSFPKVHCFDDCFAVFRIFRRCLFCSLSSLLVDLDLSRHSAKARFDP